MRRGLRHVCRHRRVLGAAAVQVAVLAVAWQLYRYGRFLVRDQRREALANAAAIIELEKSAELHIEPAIQRLALEHRIVIEALNNYYVYMHVAATVVCLAWLFIRHRDGYRSCRRVLFIVMPIGLLVHAGFPLAPPRVAPGTRMLDTLAAFGPAVYSRDQFASITNQFAAMPSFHVGWAALVAYYVIRWGRTRLRWAALVHPLVMTVAVVATANHYLLDAAVGTLLMAAAIAITNSTRQSAVDGARASLQPTLPRPLMIL